ncbi:flagellar basal body rod protein FlgB [Cohnella sp. CFH 77786]|uniref:flagellar basal body rod protein FlgB n=1 Tax=Cohnella sp. CFH 77786 TaxID=2662265 RepID=UPI001C60D00E|nr:flagellar basal body rod protein FlgB [Cohnella sp. CFH 77786]MBW5444581.1 flagellar basal body rod protein FlgB [Cohnella sp. CFH 77786]
MDLLSGASFQRLEGAIHAASMRQQVLANNIANVDTPNFKRSDVAFEEMLSQAMGSGGMKTLALKTSDPRHISNGVSASGPVPSVVTEESTVFNNSRNNVDIDKEMSLVAENQLRYNLFIQQMNHNVKMMRIGIEGRG